MGTASLGKTGKPGHPLQILIIEHSPADVELCLRELEKGGLTVTADVVETAEEFEQRIDAHPYDIILADYRFPQWTGMEALTVLQQRGKDIPFILVTGALGEETAVECIKKGASDYVLKDRMFRLPLAVHRAMEEKSLREEHTRAQQALREANEKLTGWVRELEQHAREITLVNEMGDLLQTCAAPEEAYAVIGHSAEKLFPAESGGLYVFNISRNLVEAVAHWGNTGRKERVFAPDDCWALRRGQVHVVENPSGGLLCRHLEAPPRAASMCVPMMAQGEALGLLHLLGHEEEPVRPEELRKSLSESKQRLAVTVAGHIALSLANLRLREVLRNQSIRDPLSGLFNRRYMEESLERELHRAARKQRPLGLILLDLDHFKLVNDTYGHEAGDGLLREVGFFLQSRTRREDIACRYGGEEFLLILPEASLESTRQRAEQLRQDYKNLTVHRRGRSVGAVTVSLGVAVFPEHGSSATALLRAADAALYCAKTEGRDRVVVSQGLEEKVPMALAHDGGSS
jgi:diguanylate cyclase (GGDEF)-like protein